MTPTEEPTMNQEQRVPADTPKPFRAKDAAVGNPDDLLNFYGQNISGENEKKVLARLSVTSEDLMAQKDSIQEEAFMLAAFWWDEAECYNLGWRLCTSPRIHRLVQEWAEGTTTFQEFVAICYLAGQISGSYLNHRVGHRDIGMGL